jgi:hypothetical protein
MRFIAVLLSVVFVLVGAMLCYTGDKQYEEAQIFAVPQSVTYDKFARERPLEGWYRVDGGVVDLTEAGFRSASSVVTATGADRDQLAKAVQVYIPYHSAGNLRGPADIILLTKDAWLMKSARTAAAGAQAQVHNTEPRVIQGMVRLPSTVPDWERRALGSSITTQSIVIEEYTAPSPRRAIATMAAGGALILSTAMLWLYIWQKDRQLASIPGEFLSEDYLFEEDDEDEDEL